MSLTAELDGIGRPAKGEPDTPDHQRTKGDPELRAKVEHLIGTSGVTGAKARSYLAALIRNGLGLRKAGYPSAPKELAPPDARFVEHRAGELTGLAVEARNLLELERRGLRADQRAQAARTGHAPALPANH